MVQVSSLFEEIANIFEYMFYLESAKLLVGCAHCDQLNFTLGTP